MTRPTLHPVDDPIYTGLLLLVSAEDDLTQTKLHKELNQITGKDSSIVSTLQKIKKLERYNLILKEEKGGIRNAKKVYINIESIVWIIAGYLHGTQEAINKEIKQEFSYWKLVEKEYINLPSINLDDFRKILFENIIKEISTSYNYVTKKSYDQNEFFYFLNNAWFISLVKYILRFHARNPQHYEVTFSQLLSTIIEYFIIYYEDIDKYITNSTNEKLIELQNEIFDLQSEKELHDYIKGKNDTLSVFEHIRYLRLVQPMFSHTTTALWILESQTRI